MKRPNILFLMCDQMQKKSLQEALTPNFDSLVKDSVYFNNAYTTNAVCSPARASLMTGLLPHNHGVISVTHTMDSDQCRIREVYPHFAISLKENGYNTGYFGKWHVDQEEDPTKFGWDIALNYNTQKNKSKGIDEYYDIKYYSEDTGYNKSIFYAVKNSEEDRPDMKAAVEDAKSFIINQKTNDRPWICFVSLTQPHDPFVCMKNYYDQYEDLNINIPDNWEDDLKNRPNVYKRAKSIWDQFSKEDKIKAKRCYLASISEIDHHFGTLINYLKQNRQYDDTVIIFTTDHGEHMGAHGLFCKNFCAGEEVYNIPMIIKGKDYPKATVSNARVGLHDLCQTILSISGCDNFEYNDSKTFIDALIDPKTNDINFTTGYAEYFGTRLMITQRVVYNKNYKFIFNGFDFDELYDLEKDPYEMCNLAEKQECSQVLKDMYGNMWEYVKKTGDKTLENIHYPILRLAKYGPASV